MNENEVKEEIKDWLKYNNWYNFAIWQGRYSTKGISDRIAIKNGIVLFIEVKSTTGKQSVEQQDFQAFIQRNGGHYVLARSYEDVSNYVRGL